MPASSVRSLSLIHIALARMATSDHRKVEVGPDDFVIISARPIPGNEKTVGNVVNELMKRGCDVVYESMYEVCLLYTSIIQRKRR